MVMTYQIWRYRQASSSRLVTAYFNKKAAYEECDRLNNDEDEFDWNFKVIEHEVK